MSRTNKGSKAPGHEFWSRRPYSGIGHGRVCKDICHGMERAQRKALIAEELIEAETTPDLLTNQIDTGVSQ